MIQFNNISDIKGVYYNGYSIQEVNDYLGKVWPTSFNGKWLATYADSHTASAACDASSAITNNEIAKTNLVSVEIGDCVTTIGDGAFNACSNLSSVTIPNSVTSIGNSAFRNCHSLTIIELPSGLTSIGTYAFEVCHSLASIEIPNSVTSISDSTFSNCTSLTSVTIGSGVTSIGSRAFNPCSALTEITINATIPPTFGSFARPFDNTNNCPIYVPCESVDAYKAAWSRYASRITCIQPTPNNVIDYVSSVKEDIDITNFTPNATAHTFDNGVGRLEFPSDVTEIKASAFEDPNTPPTHTMSAITLPTTITAIGEMAFRHRDRLASIDIPSGVTRLEKYVFQSCSFTSITIPSGVTYIGYGAFNACQLTEVTVPNSVITIDDKAFYSNPYMTACTIGSGVTSIGDHAFTVTNVLKTITCIAPTPPIITNHTFLFDNVDYVYVPSESVNAYKSADNWSLFGNKIQAIP